VLPRRTESDPEELGLALVGEGVRHRQGSRVVAVGTQIRIDEQAGGGSLGRP